MEELYLPGREKNFIAKCMGRNPADSILTKLVVITSMTKGAEYSYRMLSVLLCLVLWSVWAERYRTHVILQDCMISSAAIVLSCYE